MPDAAAIRGFVEAVETRIRKGLRARCEAYKPSFQEPEVFNVVTALLARQATLAIELASAPQLWNGHSAPLFLRAMTDVQITLSWILLDATTRARQYIDHGLGQAVLALEHRKKDLDQLAADSREQVAKMIEAEEAWVNSQKWSFLVDINVGSWSGKTARQMAEEAGILDFYNNVYTPFTQCVHSTWHHVGRFNSLPSASPLTRQLWVPRILEESSDPWYLKLAVKYVDKSFNLFDEKALHRTPCSDLEEWIDSEAQSRFSIGGGVALEPASDTESE